MSKLHDFISENRRGFDTQVPPDGHMERFRQKLMAQKPVKRINTWFVAGAAAVAGLAITASISLMLNYSGLAPSLTPSFASANLSPELAEIDTYYQQQVSQKQQQISTLMSGTPQAFERDVLIMLQEMNESYSRVLTDMARTPRPDMAMFVLTRYYQTQLDVLDEIIDRFNTVNMFNE